MPNLKDTTYLFIKNKILDCSYAPNSFINEAEIMKEIDVSRTPVREAFSKLVRRASSRSSRKRAFS